MPEQNEVPPIEEQKQRPKDATPAPKKEDEIRDLKQMREEIGLRVEAAKEKIDAIIKSAFDEEAEIDSSKPIVSSHLMADINALAQEQDHLTEGEYLTKGTDILRRWKILNKQINAEAEATHKRKDSDVSDDIWDKKQHIEKTIKGIINEIIDRERKELEEKYAAFETKIIGNEKIMNDLEVSSSDPKTYIADFIRSLKFRDIDALLSKLPTYGFYSHGYFGMQGTKFILNGDFELWKAIKQSESLNAVLGDAIVDLDHKFYETIVAESLIDTEGRAIDRLIHYPTPDVIRNLVLIAAADYANYRTVHANGALASLAERSDWTQILETAQMEYPSLSGIRSLLQGWDHTGQSSHPDIQKAAGSFSAQIYGGAEPNSPLRKLSLQAVPDKALIDILRSKKTTRTPQSSLETLKSVLQIIENQGKESTYRFYAFQYTLKETLMSLSSDDLNMEMENEQTLRIQRLAFLGSKIQEHQDSFEILEYLTDSSVMLMLTDLSLPDQMLPLLTEAYAICPNLLNHYGLTSILEKHKEQLLNREGLLFLNSLAESYDDNYILQRIVDHVTSDKLTRARALDIATTIKEFEERRLSTIALDFPELFLGTDEDVEFFKQVVDRFDTQSATQLIMPVATAVRDGRLAKDLVLTIPEKAPLLLAKRMEIFHFILRNGNILIKDVTDLQFLNSLIATHGNKGIDLIKEYGQSIAEGIISTADKALVLEFLQEFRSLSPEIIKEYKEAKAGGYEKILMTDLKSIAERLTGYGSLTDTDRAKPYFKALVRHVYAENAGGWSKFELNERCQDRNSDLAGFKIDSRYEIDLLSGGQIRLKEGQQIDQALLESLKSPILQIARRGEELQYNSEKIKLEVEEEINTSLQNILNHERYRGISSNSLQTIEDKLFVLVADGLYGTKSMDSEKLKHLLLSYEFANFDDVRDYIRGTSDRVSRASNQDYALLCELDSFYSDRLKELGRRLIQNSWDNPVIKTLMPQFFNEERQGIIDEQKLEKRNKFQIGKLGISDSFIKQAQRILGKNYSSEQIAKIIDRYEKLTEGFANEEKFRTKRGNLKALFGQIRSQRQRTLQAIQELSGITFNPKNFHLGEINLSQYLEAEKEISDAKYNSEQFASYTIQKYLDIFSVERNQVETELNKFESLTGSRREMLYGYITKSKESVNARMTGGVCVAGDSKMWDMSNYFQLVFQEPDSYRCQGLVILHHFEQDGKKIIAASLNPSSTYLYGVDETALFNGIMTTLEKFATDNGFDAITFSKNRTVRTNRTGGEFEKAMDLRVAKVSKDMTFDPPQTFSYNPSYSLSQMNIVWEKPS